MSQEHDRDLQITTAEMPAGPPAQYAGGVVDAPWEDVRPSPIARLHGMLRGRYKFAIPLALVGLAIGAWLGYRSEVAQYRSSGEVLIHESVQTMGQDSTITAWEAFMDNQLASITRSRTRDWAMEDPEWKAVGRGMTDDAKADFANRLGVSRAGSERITVSYVDPDPNVATTAVGCVIRAYQKLFEEVYVQVNEKRLADLKYQVTTLQADVKSLEDRIRLLAGDYLRGDVVEQQYTYQREQYNQADARYKDIRMNMLLQESLYKQDVTSATQPANGTQPANPKQAAPPRAAPPIAQATPEELATLDKRLFDLITDRDNQMMRLKELRKQFGEKNPNIRIALNQLAVVNETIADRAEYLRHSMVPGTGPTATTNGGVRMPESLVSLQRQFAVVTNLREEALKEMTELANKTIAIQALEDEKAGKERRLAESTETLQAETMKNNTQVVGHLEVTSFGEKPLGPPTVDKRKQMAGAWGLAGGVLGFGVILLIGFMDQRVKNLADVQGGLNGRQRLLGILPTLPDDLADPEQAAFAAHCVHRIRTMLEVGPLAGRRRVVAITSPMPGDGKTSLVLSLGLSFAAADSKTLLIDCDVVGGGLTSRMRAIIRRKIGEVMKRQGLVTAEQLTEALKAAQDSGKRLGEVLVDMGFVSQEDMDQALVTQKESTVGLMDVLDGAPLEECIMATGTPGLFVLPLGSARAHMTGRVSPRAIRRIVEEARRLYDVTLVDTGPLLGSLESSIIASEADEVILTLARGEQRSLVDKSISHLQAIGAHLAGLVYNRAKSDDIEASDFSPSTRLSIMRSQPDDMSVAGNAASRNGNSSRLGPVAGAVVSSTVPQETVKQ